MRQVWLAIVPKPCLVCGGRIHFELCVEHGDPLRRQCNCGLVELGCPDCRARTVRPGGR